MAFDFKPTLADFGLSERMISDASNNEETYQRRSLIVCLSMVPVLFIVCIAMQAMNGASLGDSIAGSVCFSGVMGFPLFFLGVWISHLCWPIIHASDVDVKKRHEEYMAAVKEAEVFAKEVQQVRDRQSAEYWLKLDWREFEIRTAQLFRQLGYSVELTPSTGDGGVDIYLKRDREKTIVQCKKYSYAVGPNVVREMHGLRHSTLADHAIVISTGGFTSGAISYAKENNIRLIDLAEIVSLQRKADA